MDLDEKKDLNELEQMEKLKYIVKGDQVPVEFQQRNSFKKLQNVSKFLRKDFQ